MTKKLFQNNIYLKKSTIHGYGVFAGKDIRKGEKIEECYYILAKKDDDYLMDYFFDINKKNGIILGFGCIYNHSDDANADYDFNRTRKIATFEAIKSIKKGEEIFISYGEEWFKTRDLKKKEMKNKKSKKRKK